VQNGRNVGFYTFINRFYTFINRIWGSHRQ
jgi:hypothetical protein